MKTFKKIIMPVMICLMMILRFLAPVTAFASVKMNPDNDERFYKYVPFATDLCRSGYCWFDSDRISKFDQTESLSIRTNVTIEILESNKYFVDFVRAYYPDYRDFSKTFDIYEIFGFWTGGLYQRSGVMVVEKGSKVVYMRDLSSGEWDGYYEFCYTDSPHVFCMVDVPNKFNADTWAFYDDCGYDLGQNGLKSNYSDTSDSFVDGVTVKRIQFYTSNKGNADFCFTNCAVCPDLSSVKSFFGGDDSVAQNKSSSFVAEKQGCDSFGWDDFDC